MFITDFPDDGVRVVGTVEAWHCRHRRLGRRGQESTDDVLRYIPLSDAGDREWTAADARQLAAALLNAADALEGAVSEASRACVARKRARLAAAWRCHTAKRYRLTGEIRRVFALQQYGATRSGVPFLIGTSQGVIVSDPGWYPPLEGAYWQRPAEDYPTPTPEPAPAQAKRNWVVPAALAVGIAGVASAVTLGVVLWPRQVTAPAPSTVAVPVQPPVSTTSAPQPVEVVSQAVKSSMQKDFDSDPDLSALKVTKVALVHKSGNEYKGIATVRTSDGESHDVSVDVTVDDDNLLWETPPGALAFAYEPPPPRPAVTPPPAASSPVENFKICPSGLSGVASAETSCAFADSVRSSWYSTPGTAVLAYSPVTHQSYMMQCAPAVTDVWPEAKRCVGTNAGGILLIVYID